MSKAFTRESDDHFDEPVLPSLVLSLPPGAKNLLTPDGGQRMRAELERLLESARRKSAEEPSSPVPHHSTLDARIRSLEEILASGVIVPVPPEPWDRVRFGATVTVRDRSGAVSDYRIVGPAEIDLERGWISMYSPIGKALMNQAVGQRIRFRIPDGEEELEIISIRHD